jgi:N4-gp56 family major capsid protein
VKVRVFPKRTAQGPITENAALAETAMSSLTVKSLTIQAYGDYDTLTAQSIQFTSDDLKARLLQSMADALGAKLEQVTYDVLKNASGTQSITLDVAGVIDYEEVLKAQASLKKKLMDPSQMFLIIGPDQEKDLLLDASVSKVADYSVGTVVLPGEIGRVGNIRILTHPLANVKSAAAGALNGILIDSSRAFGQAFGLPLTFSEQMIPEKNAWKEVAWTFFGAGVVDPDAICLLKNA